CFSFYGRAGRSPRTYPEPIHRHFRCRGQPLRRCCCNRLTSRLPKSYRSKPSSVCAYFPSFFVTHPDLTNGQIKQKGDTRGPALLPTQKAMPYFHCKEIAPFTANFHKFFTKNTGEKKRSKISGLSRISPCYIRKI